jgi:ATP-dependent DNA ligase
MHNLINELNKSNSANYKLDVLRKHKDNELLKRVLELTYDKVKRTYGITTKNVKWPEKHQEEITLEESLDILENDLATRKVTGNAAIALVEDILKKLSKENAEVFAKILDRDLKINMGRSQINKVFKNLIIKPPYMRCGLYTEKTAKKINFPAICQLKCDGMFQAVTVDNGQVTFTARSGEEREFPEMAKEFSQLKDGVYIGEVLVKDTSNRAEANGIINSDDPDHKRIYMQLWDMISLDEYSRPKDKNNKTPYHQRLSNLKEQLKEKNFQFISLVETHKVDTVQEALKYVSEWMKQDLEGGILKDRNNIFIDHTSPTQLKLKLEIDADVRCTGFYEGTPGTKREKTFGGITYATDDGKVQGRTSGFTDTELEDFNSRREELIGKVFTIQFNDITKARDSDTYALSHPRFIEFRMDKNETDTLERILEMKKMAMEIGDDSNAK